MRIVLLILLINTFSLPLQAMSMRTVTTNISCDMQDMPCYSENGMGKMQHDEPQLKKTVTQKSSNDCSNKDNCSDCKITCLSSFIVNDDQLHLSTYKQSSTLYYEFNTPLKQHLDNLYRPPLIS